MQKLVKFDSSCSGLSLKLNLSVATKLGAMARGALEHILLNGNAHINYVNIYA